MKAGATMVFTLIQTVIAGLILFAGVSWRVMAWFYFVTGIISVVVLALAGAVISQKD